MLKALRPSLVSEEEFLALPESMERIELVDGEMVISASPTVWHQEILGRIFVALRNWASTKARPITVLMAPVDVRFGTDRILQPDLLVVLSGVSPDHVGPLQTIPEICIEVLSTNRVYDRVTKRHLYAEAGVKEYWMIEPSGVVERRSGEGLAQVEEMADRVASPLLPGFTLELSVIFRK